MSWVYRCITSLETPCGEVLVVDQEERRCRFSVRKNPYCPDYYLAYGAGERINTENNYLLCVDADDLQAGRMYRVYLAGAPLRFGDSDEHTEAVSGTWNGYSIAIGAYDPNDEEKMRQAVEYSLRAGITGRIVPPLRYDESRFVKYDVELLADCSGFRFRLLDRSVREVKFPVAWIENGNGEQGEYEAAVEFWTT